MPCNSRIPGNDERNAEICRQYANGELVSDIARTFGISVQRIHQIIRKLSPTPAKPRLPISERNRVIRERFENRSRLKKSVSRGGLLTGNPVSNKFKV